MDVMDGRTDGRTMPKLYPSDFVGGDVRADNKSHDWHERGQYMHVLLSSVHKIV